MRYCILAVIFVFLTSCSPEQRLARLLKKYPELVKTDFTEIDTTLKVPEIRDTNSIFIPPNYAGADSLTDRFYDRLDSSSLVELNTGIKTLLNDALDIDTTIEKRGRKTHIKGENGVITITDEIVPDSINFKAKVAKTVVQAPRDLTWLERKYVKIGEKIGFAGMAFSLILLILLLIFIARIVLKKIFR